MSLENTTIHAGSSIYITNKFTADAKPLAPATAKAFKEQYEQLFPIMATRSPEIKPAKLPKDFDPTKVRTIQNLEVDVLARTAQAGAKTTYSEILIENDATNTHMKLENKGALLSLKHIPENATATNRVEILRRNETDAADVGKILLQGDKVEISFSTDGQAANARTLSLDANGISIEHGNKVHTFVFANDTITLTHKANDAQKAQSIKMTGTGTIFDALKYSVVSAGDATIAADTSLKLTGTQGFTLKGMSGNITENSSSLSITKSGMIQIG